MDKDINTSHDIFRHNDAGLAAAVQAVAKLALAMADQLSDHGSGLRDKRLLARALAEEEIASAFDCDP